MKRKFNLLQLFSIVDGRLSYAGMDGVSDLLEYVCDFKGIMTHHLPTAHTYIKNVWRPKWFTDVEADLNTIKGKVGNDFEPLMDYIKANNTEYELTQIPETMQPEFQKYMIDNSLLLKIGSKNN